MNAMNGEEESVVSHTDRPASVRAGRPEPEPGQVQSSVHSHTTNDSSSPPPPRTDSIHDNHEKQERSLIKTLVIVIVVTFSMIINVRHSLFSTCPMSNTRLGTLQSPDRK